MKWDNRLLNRFSLLELHAIAGVRRDKPMTSDGTYLAKTLFKKMVVIPRQFSHHSVFQRNYLWKILCRRTIYTSEGHRIAQFQDSALQNVKIVSSCHINPPPLPSPPPQKKNRLTKIIYIHNVGVCSSNSLATRWGARNPIFILISYSPLTTANSPNSILALLTPLLNTPLN